MSQECLQVNTWLKNWFYDESEVDSLVNAKSVTVEKKGTADTGFLASYVVKQGGSQVGATINIPKDFLVKSGSVKTCSTANVPVQGYIVGDKYLDLVVNTKDGSGSDEHLYVLVSDLVDVPIDWSDIENKPSSFTPSSHNHTVSNITDFPTVPTKTSDLTNDSGYLTSHQDITGKEDKSNKVANWSSTVTDTNYPTEKLVKNSLDNKASSTDLTNGLQNIGGYTIHTVYSVSGTASAYSVSEGLIYTQQTPVFFLVKNTIGDNEANATLKYYPNGNNITIIDTFSNTSASPIQQGVWKKDTWGLFFCTNNDWVQLRCVFYDSVDIDEKLGDLSGDVTSLSSDVTSLSSNITNLDNIERISSTHSPSTNHWTGKSQTLTSLENGTKILYRLTKTPTIDDKVAYLTLTLSNGNTTSEYSVLFKGATSTAIEFSHNSFVQNDVFLLEFKDNVWRVRDFFAIGYRPTVARTGSYNDLSDKPTIPTVPTNVSAFNNDSGYLTAHQDISGKEDKSNKVASWNSTPTDNNYPSEKLVKSEITNLTTQLNNLKQRVYYGTCSTIASTQTKEVTCDDDFELETGCMLVVKFTTAQSYNASSTNPVKITVNQGTSVNVQYINGNYSIRYMWSANEIVCFIYDGTNWILLDNGMATTSYYGVTKLNNTVTSTSTTLSATANSVKTAYDKGVEALERANSNAPLNHSHSIANLNYVSTVSVVVTYTDETTETIQLLKYTGS